MNIAVILAGGVGRRMGYSKPKQFYKVAGKTVIEHTVDVFETDSLIDEIAIVINESFIGQLEEIVLKNNWKKVKKILSGGNERYMSSLSAIQAYDDDDNCNCNLIFHDAVRPLVNHRIIEDVVRALENYNAVDVAVPATDTIIEVDHTGQLISNIPDRKLLRRGQTPQGFKLSVIRDAYKNALQDPNFVSSDDCGTVIKYLPDEPVFVVEGEESNMKLTYKEDTFLLDKLFQLKSSELRSVKNLTELRDKVIVIFGGSSGIGLEMSKQAEVYGANVFPFSRSVTQTDVSKLNDVRKALGSVYKLTQKIDFIVDSAAILSKEPLVSMNECLIETIIKTNYNGMVNVARESYPYLKESKGQLLLYTSSSYTRGRAFYSIYSSTKCAVVNFMQAIAQEWDNEGIRVNVINPERTKTPMRVKNFGIEPEHTLLEAEVVAEISLQTLLSGFTGQVIDVKCSNLLL